MHCVKIFFEVFLTTKLIYDKIVLEISKSDKDFPGIFSKVPLMPDIDLTKTTFYPLLHSWPGLTVFPQYEQDSPSDLRSGFWDAQVPLNSDSLKKIIRKDKANTNNPKINIDNNTVVIII